MEQRQIDREKIIRRVRAAIKEEAQHFTRVYFDEKGKIWYRIGPGVQFVKVVPLGWGKYAIGRKPVERFDLKQTRD